MNESQDNYAERKKINQKKFVMHDGIFIKNNV